MFKKIFYNKGGFTFLELMIVIAVTVIITSVFVVSTRETVRDQVDTSTNQLLSDIRYARGLATSRVTYNFGGALGTVYPPGGYGVHFTDGDYRYTVFADNGSGGGFSLLAGDKIIKTGTLKNTSLDLEDYNQTVALAKYFTFQAENEVVTNFVSDSQGKYKMSVTYNPGTGGEGYRGIITLGEQAADGSVFVSLGIGSIGYTPTCSTQNQACDGSQPCCFDQGTCTASICTIPPTNPPQTSCFPAGTTVLMADYSYKNIESIQVGDYVVSYDEVSQKEVAAKVLELASPVREHMCELIFVDASLKLTDEHPVYTQAGWKSINPEKTIAENDEVVVTQLTLGDQIFFREAVYKELIKINCWQEEIQTYNLKEVENYNTFFADDVLVHNASAPSCGGSTDPVGGIF